jgi:hypothetical protein
MCEKTLFPYQGAELFGPVVRRHKSCQGPEARAFASREDDAPTLLVNKLCRHSAKGDFEGPSQRIPTRSFARDRRIDFGISGTAYRYSVVVLMITLDAGARQVSRSSKSRTPSGHEKPLLVFTASGLLLTGFPSHDRNGIALESKQPRSPSTGSSSHASTNLYFGRGPASSVRPDAGATPTMTASGENPLLARYT